MLMDERATSHVCHSLSLTVIRDSCMGGEVYREIQCMYSFSITCTQFSRRVNTSTVSELKSYPKISEYSKQIAGFDFLEWDTISTSKNES